MNIIVPSVFSLSENSGAKIPERKIVVVIPSYNNSLQVTHECLVSVLNQNYSNFEVMFSDDCSPQPAIEQSHKTMLAKLDTKKKVSYHRNTTRLGSMANQWHAFHRINPNNNEDNREIIIVLVDGDDLLLNKDVLQRVNELHHCAWLTYGNFVYYPKMQENHACYEVAPEIIRANCWRNIPGFPMTHLRTMRLSLLKDLPLESFLYYDNFYPAASDCIMWPLCEKAGMHAVFNEEYVYAYRQTEQSVNKTQSKTQRECAQYARKQKSFTPLSQLPFQKPTDLLQCDLIVFSYNDPGNASNLLNSIEKNVVGLEAITVLYQANSLLKKHTYQSMNNTLNSVTCIEQLHTKGSYFKNLLLKILNDSTSDYILLCSDTGQFTRTVWIKDCMSALQKTHSHAFYLNCDEHHIKEKIAIGSHIYAWRLGSFQKDFINGTMPNSLTMVIYSKKELYALLCTLPFCDAFSLEKAWVIKEDLKSKIGLCFEQPRGHVTGLAG